MTEPLIEVLTLAVAHLGDDALDEAATCVEQALAQAPGHPDALHLRGVVAYRRGDLKSAEVALVRAIEARPQTAAYHVNLGNTRRARGDAHGAEIAYRDALAREPNNAHTHCNLGGLLSAHDRLDEAMNAYREALRLAPTLPEGHQGLAWCLGAAGRHTELPELYRRWHTACPDDPVAAYLAEPGAAHEPEAVRDYFDRFAASYDAVLDALLDQGPSRLEALLESRPDVPPGTVLDLGCGTGRLGPCLRPRATRLIGVDLSTDMLEIARARGLYDELEAAELNIYARAQPAAFDLVVLGDVTGYLRDLGPPLAAIGVALRPGGFLAMSVERLDASTDGSAGDHGRWQHGDANVVAALTAAGLQPVAHQRGPLRQERGTTIEGVWVGAVRPESP